MYYFLKKSDFNLENYDFDIELSPRLTKKEQHFLKELLDEFDSQSEYSKIDIRKLELTRESIEGLLESLMKKTFKCWFSHEKKMISRFYFGLLRIAALEGNEIIYDFSPAVRQSMETGNIFSRTGILNHLRFSLSYTKAIYNLILKENKHKGFLELSLEELKDTLDMGHDKYPRFYDLETKVLKPIARDLEISENYIWFEKVKGCDSKSGKITGVKIHYSNLYHIALHRDTNTLIREYAENIEDFALAYQKIYHFLKENNLKNTREYLRDNHSTFFTSQSL